MNLEKMKEKYPIYTGVNNTILRQKSEEIKNINKDIQEFGNILLKLMEEYDGIGLAAPQVGENKRMIAVTSLKENKKGEYEVKSKKIMINPEIVKFFPMTELDEEGCLSVPGVTGEVERPKKVEVFYQDINGKQQKEVLEGINARIIQHEMDHLDGILFVDKMISKPENKIKSMIDFDSLK